MYSHLLDISSGDMIEMETSDARYIKSHLQTHYHDLHGVAPFGEA